MSFEIKYGADGQPLKNQPPLSVVEEQEPVEQPAETVEAAPVEETAPEQEPIVEEKPVPKESDRDKNFREIREAKARAERERDEYARRVAELEARTAPKPIKQEEDDEDLSLGDDDLVEGKHVSKVTKQIKKLKEELKQYKEQSATQTAESRLRAQYADFDKVVSLENIQALNAAYPELAQTVHANADLYTKAVAAYTLIKKFGIYQENPLASEKERITKNIAKPRPLTSVSPQQGESALARANAFADGLTNELKEQLLKEMMDARRNY